MSRLAAAVPDEEDIGPAGWLDGLMTCSRGWSRLGSGYGNRGCGRRRTRQRQSGRQSGRTIAEPAGDKKPLGMQRLLTPAV
jgi:hypothetical protein